MSDFNTARVDPNTGQLTYASDSDTLSITVPVGTNSTAPPIQALGVIEGYNLGDGTGIFTTFTLNSRQISGFKSLLPGQGVTFVTDDQTITINSSATNVLAALNFETVGSGPSLFRQKIAGEVQLRSLLGGGIVAVQQGDETVTVSATAVTSIGLSGGAAISVLNSPITSSGTIDIDLTDTGVTPGVYQDAALTIDSKGRVTAASLIATPPTTVQAGPGLLVTPGPNFTVGLTTTGIAPGMYVAPSLIIDAYGRITSATNNTITGPVTGQNLGSGSQVLSGILNQQISLRSIVGSGSISVAQDVNTITISSPMAGTVTSISAAGSNGILVTGGPISTSGTLTIALADTPVSPGTYDAASITVDSTGRITSATANALTGEANTASNLPGGYGLFNQKNGIDLQFKSLVPGQGISISATSSSVVIEAVSAQGTPWQFVTSSIVLQPFQRYAVNTLSGSFTVALPQSPSDGVMVTIRDLVGSFSANPLSITSASPMLSNGSIVVISTPVTGICAIAGSVIEFIYSEAVDRWYICS